MSIKNGPQSGDKFPFGGTMKNFFNEEPVRGIADGSGYVFFVKDSGSRYLFVNRMWEELTTIDFPTALGKEDYELFSSEAINPLSFEKKSYIRDGLIEEWETLIDTPQGERIYKVKKFPLMEGEDPSAFCFVMSDITDLRSEISFLQMIISNTSDVILVIDENELNHYISPNIENIFGWNPVELLGRCFWEKIYSDDIQRAREFHSELSRNPGVLRSFECRYMIKSGDYKWIEFRGKYMLLDNYSKGVIGNFHDITARKQTEESLIESEERFKILHNASFGGIAIHDKGVILDCNMGLSEISGFSIDELVGMDGLLLITEGSRDKVMGNILRGYEEPYEAYGIRKNGEEYPLRLEAKNIPYKGKQIRVVEFRDITQQKTAEDERNKLQDQLVQSQKMEAIGRLAGGVAHDFNNMLGVIIGFSELALAKVDENGPVTGYLHEIFNAAHRSMEITRQLLAFARRQTVAPAILDFNETIESMLKMLQRLIGEDVLLKWKPGENLWNVSIDPSQVNQILANLSVNARDAIADTGTVTISTENVVLEQEYDYGDGSISPGEYVLLVFEDTGSGMAEDVLANIFEPFFTTKGQNRGTGLGLATVYGIIKQNNGHIYGRSSPGEGALFYVYFPAFKNTKSLQKQTGDFLTPHAEGNETVLLVEDEAAMLLMTTTMLQELGYTVVTADKPEQAIEIAGKMKGMINLLITDVIMPGMNGRVLAEKMRDVCPEIKVLFMSGYTADVIGHHGVLDDGVQFVQKPFSRQHLAVKVREALTQ